MAILKVFPVKSATIYSYYPLLNTGLDEILEVSTFESINNTNEVSRALIKFSSDDILSAISYSTGSISSSLRLSLANASELPIDYTLECYPISGSWEIGTGRRSNNPQTTDGVNWTYKDSINTWSVSGSNYYSGSYKTTQSFVHNSIKDINLNVTNIVNNWLSGSIQNDGFLIKNSGSIEFTSASKFELNYFSANTHTIYPPCLEIKWDDSSYITGSLSQITSNNMVITINNNKGTYEQDSIHRFELNVRDKYPSRSFQTSSVYLNNDLLPRTSYWSLKDLDTEEIIIDFDTSFTKISADGTGNYFKLYMNNLEPERNYKILIKTIINQDIQIIDNNYYFKVVR